jgi:hypothetical protein
VLADEEIVRIDVAVNRTRSSKGRKQVLLDVVENARHLGALSGGSKHLALKVFRQWVDQANSLPRWGHR